MNRVITKSVRGQSSDCTAEIQKQKGDELLAVELLRPPPPPNDLHGVRLELVLCIRAQIAAGKYLDDEKIDACIEVAMRDMR